MWTALRRREPAWWREVRTDLWTLDFYCPAARLAVEVDGGYHSERSIQERDQYRDIDNAGTGILTLRFTNSQVLQRRQAVLSEIERVIRQRTGGRVRQSWLSALRAHRARSRYHPEYDLRPARRPSPHPSGTAYPTGDPAASILDRVRGRNWASKRDAGPFDR
jgi:very-short-patch-repair endonuclease